MIDRLKKAISPRFDPGDLHKPGAVATFAAKMVFKGIVLAILASLAMLAFAATLGILPFPLSGVIVYSVVMCWLIGGVVFYAMWLPLGRLIFRLSASQARFERLSRTDPLSGLLNRRGFNDVFEQQCENASLAIFDIDRFKAINDGYGHAAGDMVISAVARSFRRVFGPDHFIARLGGEEFAVIIRGGRLAERMAMVEQLRHRIAACPVQFQGRDIAMTISAGVAEFSPGRSREHIYTAADRTLYLAKTAGRNRAMHESDLPILPRVAGGEPVLAEDLHFPFAGAEKCDDERLANAS